MSELKYLWDKSASMAISHREISTKLHQVCSEVYGFRFDDVESLVDNDRIIDTIDVGVDSLTFDEFDKLMRDAKDSPKNIREETE